MTSRRAYFQQHHPKLYHHYCYHHHHHHLHCFHHHLFTFTTFSSSLYLHLLFILINSTMEQRNRPNHTSQDYFSVEDYFLSTEEHCTGCQEQRPEYDHFHCRVCHSNLKTPVNFKNMNNRLKRHYNRFSIAKKYKGKYYPAHSLRNPSRSTATVFKDLSSEEKTLVREGVIAFCTAVHNLSWKSQACMNSIIQEVVDCNYSSSASKAAAICKGLFGLKTELKLKNELQQVNHIAVAFDSSTNTFIFFP